jgi:hypothetical protein
LLFYSAYEDAAVQPLELLLRPAIAACAASTPAFSYALLAWQC